VRRVSLLSRQGRLALVAAPLLACAAFPAFLALDAFFPFPMTELERAPATQVLARDGTPLRIFLPPDGILRMPVKLDEVDPGMVAALVGAEDRWFGVHPGVNPLAVVRALGQNVRAGRIVSGASTIPMQVARLVERRPRTLAAKLVESFRALQLCWHLDDATILEHYLNLAPFGGNLEGIGAAAWGHFGKPADRLSVGEAALLVALPRAPSRNDPVRDPGAAHRARERVLAQLARSGLVAERALREAEREPLPERRVPLPFEAPHFARFVAERAPDEARVRTTLDVRVQRIAESLVRARVGELRERGIGDAAAVVIETDGRALLGMVGSADFFEVGRPGQVNGAVARRSPGSTLKPFLYALAFDAGELVPESRLLDIPTDFAGYVADNYDGVYRGRVTARQALVESLNAPAVRVLARLGVARFLELLRRGGLDSLDRPARHYGLPLVLGAGEVTLLELTNLYASLAEGGVHRPVHFRDGATSSTERILSREAAHLIRGMLSELERPDLPRAWDLTRGAPAVSWKTGTSYGHRDAWAVGFTARLAVGVWVGNLDGRPQKGISGARDAAPLLFDLLRSLDPGARDERPAPPGIATTEVCALSHELPGPFCPQRTRIATVRGTTRLHTCTHHRRVFLDAATGRRLAGRCLGARPHRPAVLEVFPAELVAWWRATGHAVAPVPALHPDCPGIPGADPPRIVSPAARTPYRIRDEAPREFQKVELSARAAPGTARVFWYQDGRLVAAGPPGAPLFTGLVRGLHRLVVVDDAGRSDEIRYAVE
jgi:penicillin-binding protein 1C